MNPNQRRILGRAAATLVTVLMLAGVGAFADGRHFTSGPESEIESLLKVLELRLGMTVAEIGAGDGEMTVLMAQRLGPGGRMFATEMGASKQEDLREAVAEAGLENVTVVEAAEKSTNLPDGCCDGIFMRRVYHHITDPRPYTVSLYESLRPGGRLAVIDFQPRSGLRNVDGVPENRGGHGMPMDLLVEELTAADFEIEQQIENWSKRNYCVVARKPVGL